MDGLIFLRDPLTPHPHEPDVHVLLRVCDIRQVPVATNLASAEILLHALAESTLVPPRPAASVRGHVAGSLAGGARPALRSVPAPDRVTAGPGRGSPDGAFDQGCSSAVHLTRRRAFRVAP